MARTALTFLRCTECGAGVACITDAIAIAHGTDGSHRMVHPRPDHRTVSLWADVRAALEHIRVVEFYLGFQPEKPRDGIDWEAVRLQLGDARAVLGAIALGLAEGADS